MQGRFKIIGAVAIVSLAITSFVWHKRDARGPASVAIPGPACWEAGQAQAYSLSYTLRTSQMDQKGSDFFGATLHDQTVTIQGLLSLHALNSHMLSLNLHPTSYSAMQQELRNPEQYFQQPIEVNFDSNCRIQTVVFDGRMSFKSREIFRSILTSMDYDRRALQSSQLAQNEDDTFGAIEVQYTYAPAQEELRKSRLRVANPVAHGPLAQAAISFTQSETRFQGVAKDVRSFFRLLESREDIRIKSPSLNADVTQAKVVRLEAQTTAPRLAAQAMDPSRRVEKKPHEVFRGQDRSTIYNQGELRRTPAPDTLDAAIDAFEAAMNANDDTKAKKILGAHLLMHPESFEGLTEKMKAGEFDTEFAAQILFLMTRLQVPQAEKLLIDLVEDSDVDSYLRMQAIMSIGDVWDASPEARKALLTLATQGPGERDPRDQADMGQRLYNTSVLAYGAMASLAADVDPGFENEAKQSFQQLMQDTTKPELLATVINGIGNFHHPDFYETLAEKLDAEHPAVRMSAAGALARMDNAGAEAVLVQRLSKDTQADVRAALANGLLSRTTLQAGSLQPLAQALRAEPTLKTREILIDVLGRASPAHPAAIDILVEQAARESDAQTLQRIGQYVPADKLLLAVKTRGT